MGGPGERSRDQVYPTIAEPEQGTRVAAGTQGSGSAIQVVGQHGTGLSQQTTALGHSVAMTSDRLLNQQGFPPSNWTRSAGDQLESSSFMGGFAAVPQLRPERGLGAKGSGAADHRGDCG